MKTLSLLIATFFAITSIAQNFEGKIVYKNSYKSKMPAVTDEQFASMLGTTQTYFIKGGDYKSEINGTAVQWQLYINKDNKLYTKTANSETLLWNDGAMNPDTVLKAELTKGVADIAGYKCDELVLTCQSGVQKYYFNMSLGVDPAVFVNHKFGNWYEVVSRTKSVPLKIVIDNAQFAMENVATEVTPVVLDKTMFDLPADAKVMKSPY